MQGPFGPQRDPHQDWLNRMEQGAAYEEWKKGRGQGGISGAGQVLLFPLIKHGRGRPALREVEMVDIKRFEDSEAWVETDLDLCAAAGDCVEVCPADVYDIVDGKVNADNIGECIECGACEDTCPNDAILKHWAW